MASIKNLSIKIKLIIGFTIVFSITGITGVVGYVGMQRMKQAQEEFIAVRVPALNSIQTFMESIRSITVGERGMMINGMVKDTLIRKKQYSTGAFNRIKKGRERYFALPLTHKEDSLLKEFDKKWDFWMVRHDNFMKKAEEKGALYDQGYSDNDPIMLEIDKQMMELILESRLGYLPVGENIQELDRNIIELIEDSHKTTIELTRKAQRNLVIMVISALMIAILISYIIISAIIKPIKAGLEFTEKVANGDLTSSLEVKSNDEIGKMINALNLTVVKLHDIVKSIKSSSNDLTTSSTELSSSSQAMAEGANEQASASEEIASSLEEMSATIQQNSDNARSTESIAKTAALKINDGTQTAKNAITSMVEIEDNMKIISDIALQTNLLSLNAAVEAASAGASGRGFSVVAAEVKKLAERSKHVAKNISVITNKTVTLSTETGQKLDDVSPKIQETARLVNEISASNIELLVGVEHINSAMGQLNISTMSTVQNSEGIATNAEKLMEHAHHLEKLVAFFSTKADEA